MEDLPLKDLPRRYTYGEASAALKEEPQTYQVEIDGKRTTLMNLFKLLVGPPPPNIMNISIRHPKYNSLHFYRFDPNSTTWYFDQISPLAKYGVLVRTHGTQDIETSPESLYDIWATIRYWMPKLDENIQRAHVIEDKRKKVLISAAETLAKNKNLPEDIGDEIASYFQGPRPHGWKAGPSQLKNIDASLFTNGEVHMNRNLKKINTRLFTEGGKRTTRKARTRKQKRKQK